MERKKVKDVALGLLAARGRATSGEIARAAAVSRQTAHAVMTGLVRDGVVEARGSGRGAHYVATGFRRYEWQVEGLEEHRVWEDIKGDPALRDVPAPAEPILEYSVSEMVNNVIDHSGSVELVIRVGGDGDEVVVSVTDTGIGVMEKIRSHMGLDSWFDALGQLSKGKLTTDPEHHTGEGIFFASKAVDRFVLAANGIEWTVDNIVGDVALGDTSEFQGTTITVIHGADSARTLESVFREYTTGFDFDTSRAIVKLFEHGDSFISRSEARRITVGLERFRVVIVDFSDVVRVGQGFVDELFRVWAANHPDTSLESVNMAGAVEFMVRRGITRS